MTTPSNQKRVKELYHMLLEMATGNFTIRMDKSDLDDELDELATELNSVASEMHTKILKAGFINPHYSYQRNIQTIYILDKDFMILGFSSDSPLIFAYPSEQLVSMNIDQLLAKQALPIWEDIKKRLRNDETFHDTMQLLFVTATKQIIPLFCTVSRLLRSDTVIICAIITIFQDILDPTASPRPSQASTIQNVYDYIRTNLEEPLPSTKKLSLMFGINEFQLKDGFRHFFNTSIYQFYTEERLKRAHFLIQQTEIPIKAIAFMCGFNDYTNFYKSFKKRFNYSPSEVLRLTGVYRK